jgi:hypothetical protein
MEHWVNLFSKVFKSPEFKLLLIIFLISVLIKSINFADHLNFSTDQAHFSTQALEIWEGKKLQLLGPTLSPHLGERRFHLGPHSYYLQLAFLLPANFDPIASSYLFMIFGTLMTFPLFYGTKWLAGSSEAAYLMVIIYSFLPLFLIYSRFFWNPNFQLVLLPVLIWLMGLFKKDLSKKVFLILSVSVGILVQFHYLFFFIVIALFFYYFLIKGLHFSYMPLYLLGIILGFVPIFLYDLNHDFYTFETLRLLIENWQIVTNNQQDPNTVYYHYTLSFVFMATLISVAILKKFITQKVIMAVFLGLLIWDLYLFVPKPTQGYGMSQNWDYLDEVKANQIIEKQHLVNFNLVNFNIVNLTYDYPAEVQKYLLKKDHIQIEEDNYTTNKYLFVITPQIDFLNHPAYEINSFKPSKIVKNWPIDPTHTLYLLERTPTN